MAATIPISLVAVLGLANAIWMLVAPFHWYENLPAGVPDYGPFNLHFVRDIGAAYLTASLGLIWGLLRPPVRTPAVALAALFYGLHAAIHVYDTLVGHVGMHHAWLDIPGVYLPAVLLALALAACRTRPS